MPHSIIQVDAFTAKPFAGNPAAVCVLSSPADEQWMQAVAMEMNLSETAFLYPLEDGFSLRWFTPAVEVPLCGHATLASAHVLWSEGHLAANATARFYSKSGLLLAQQQEDWIQLDFPINYSEPTTPHPELSPALGAPLKTVMKNSLGYLVEVESEDLVRRMKPDFSRLKLLPLTQVIVTSQAHPDSSFDFVSRFFAPGLGIDEDPVTGAAHCCLAPFWCDRLGKDDFSAYQASARGGVLRLRRQGERVLIKGQAITVMRGELVE